MIVTHPAIDPVSVHLLYVAYEGWIYTGRARWKIDKLLIIDEHGGRQSACRAPPLKSVISSTPATIPTQVKISTTATPTKESLGIGSLPSTATKSKDLDSKITTSATKSASSPPPSILPASVTSLSAPPPPSSVDKISAKSSIVPKPTPKIEVEGKLLPILRSGIPQSIQLTSSDCEIPSLADYYSHFSGNKFIKKPHPYLHNNLYTIGNGLYPNVNIHNIKKYNNAPFHNQGFGGKDTIKSLNIHQPPPPPPPPTPKIDLRETTTPDTHLALQQGANKGEANIKEGTTPANDSSVAEKSIPTLDINDELAPISIPPIELDNENLQSPIVVSTKLRPPPRHPLPPSFNLLERVEVSDSVAPESIPELGTKQENKKVLHHPSITTTYYNVVSDNKDHPARPSYVSRPRPKIHFDDSDPSKIHQWNQLGKLPTQHWSQNGFLKYQINSGQDGSKWPIKSNYFPPHPSLLPTSAKRPHANWPPIQQHNRHAPYQSYNPTSHGTLPPPSYQLYKPFATTHLNSNPQLPYQINQPQPKNPYLPSYQNSNLDDSTTKEVGNQIEFISENNITGETLKHTENSNSNTETTLMGKESSMQRVTMHHLSSDEQLTILKVNPDEKLYEKASIEGEENTSMNNITLVSEENTEGKIISDNEITSNHVNESMGTLHFTDTKEEVNFTHSMDKESNQNETSHTGNKDADKVDYIVLHKLPNGEALDLENMKTYTMVDLKGKISKKNKDGQENSPDSLKVHLNNGSEPIRPLTYLAPPPRRSDMPRSIDFPSYNGTNSKQEGIHGAHISLESKKRNTFLDENEKKNESGDKKEQIGLNGINGNENDDGNNYDEKIIKSYMSETPEDINKLKALMLESDDSKMKDRSQNLMDEPNHSPPVYIITEEDYMKHKTMLQEKEKIKEDIDAGENIAKKENNEGKIIIPNEKEDIELLPAPRKQISVKIISPYINSSITNEENTEKDLANDGNKNSTDVDMNIKRIDNNLEYHWTPIPEEETTPTSGPRVFGPQLPPKGYVPPEEVNNFSTPSKPLIDIGEIDELSKIAYVTLNGNKDDLISDMRESQEDTVNSELDENIIKEGNNTLIEDNLEDSPNTEMNVQLLPPRLSAVLTHITQHLPHRPSVSSNTPAPTNRGQVPSKERSIGQYNSYSHNSAPPYGYHNHGLFRQNKIAPVFKEDEKQPYQALHKPPLPSSLPHDTPFGPLSDIPLLGQPTFPLQQSFHSLPKSSRAIPLSPSSLEPRNYSPANHGRQNNARRINYPQSINNNQYYQSSPYQTQIVPGARDPLRYIPLHEANPISKKHVPPHHPQLRWRTRHRGGFHGRKPQQKHRRPLKHFNAKMLQASPTYASVEILRSHRRNVKHKVQSNHKDVTKPFSIVGNADDTKVIKEVPNDGQVSEPFLERKLQTNEKNETDSSEDIRNDDGIPEFITELSLISEIDNSTSFEGDITTTSSTLPEKE